MRGHDQFLCHPASLLFPFYLGKIYMREPNRLPAGSSVHIWEFKHCIANQNTTITFIVAILIVQLYTYRLRGNPAALVRQVQLCNLT